MEVVDLRILAEQAAVVAAFQVAMRGVALVDRAEQVQEVPPAGIRDLAKGGQFAVGGFEALGGQQVAVLAEGDEDDAVQDLLGDSRWPWPSVFPSLQVEVLDQPQAVLAVLPVKLVAHLALPVLGSLSSRRARAALPGRRGDQSAPLEKAVELAEAFLVAQFLKVKLLVGQRRLVAVIEAEADEVADDAPGALRQGVQVVPALLDWGTTV